MASLYYSTVVPSVFAWVMIFRVMIWVLSWHVYLVPVSFLACPIRCEISDSLASARWSAELDKGRISGAPS